MMLGQVASTLAPSASKVLALRRGLSYKSGAAGVGTSPRAVTVRVNAVPHDLVAVASSLCLADIPGLESIVPALNIKQELAVVLSAGLAVLSLVVNIWGGVITESKRAELQLELERDKATQKQLAEVQSVIARYRGPLLEAAIDLEQKLFHLVADKYFDQRGILVDGLSDKELRYSLFTIAQFLGFVEVVRREGPREAHFLQVGSPEGSDTLSTLVEGIRFVLCASPVYLQEWYAQGEQREHPGARLRPSQQEVIRRLKSRQDPSVTMEEPSPEAEFLRISRGEQRAIGTYMITTPMGAERHYTLSYGDFHNRLESDPQFREWFVALERDLNALATGPSWEGEPPFPCGRWTRLILLQQVLVELIDLLDPDCVRLPLGRRVRLMPLTWASPPGLSEYRGRLQELNAAAVPGKHPKAALEGLLDLVKGSGSKSFTEV